MSGENITAQQEKYFSVTARAKMVDQPRGGYVSMRSFKKEQVNDGKLLCENENIHGSVAGMAVDYLTRYMLGEKAEDVFLIAILGASRAEKEYSMKGYIDAIRELLSKLNRDLDDDTIISACKLSTFDVWFRNTPQAKRPINCFTTT